MDDLRTFDPNPWSPKLGIFQWIRFYLVIASALTSTFIVLLHGGDLLLWCYAQNCGGRNANITWLRRRVDGYESLFTVAGLLALGAFVLAVFAMRRSKLPIHMRLTKIARCFAFVAATWWIGWYLAMHYGYLLFPLYPMDAYSP